jgi:hypothetical protein
MKGKTPRGSCLCGTVRYRITGPILNFQYCHCSRCRKFTGSGHAANLFVRPEDLEWLQGEDSLGGYELKAEPGFTTAFCKNCGCSMPNMSSSGKFWVVPAGALDDDPEVKPARNIFWGSRAPWFLDSASLPLHEEWPRD